jgi:hypothetical protein
MSGRLVYACGPAPTPSTGGLPTFWGDTVLAMTRLDWILLALIFVVLGLWRFLLKPLG